MKKRLAKKTTTRSGRGIARRAQRVVPRPNRFHAFLKRLRAGGRSNMYGAIPYLMQAFALDREAAFRVVCEWEDLRQTEAAAARAASPGGGAASG